MFAYKKMCILLLVSLLSACQNIHQAYAPLPAVAQIPKKCMTIDEPYCHSNWWFVFQDEVLNAFMNQVITHNRELMVATLTLQKSLLEIQKNSNNQKPILTTQASVNQRNQKDISTGQTSHSTNFDVNLNASWELDLWGKLRLQHSLSDWEKNAVQADRQAIFSTLTGHAVKEYFTLININQKLADNQQAKLHANQQLVFLQTQLKLGLIANADLLPIQQTLNNLEQNTLNLSLQKSETLNTLALLVHSTVGNLPESLNNKNQMPNLPTISSILPIDIINNRPDLQALLWRLSVILEQKNIIQKNQYPTLIFTAGTIAQNANLFDLLKVPVLNWGVSLNLPSFNHKEYQRILKIADIDGQIANLNTQETIDKALTDVQNKLITLTNHQHQYVLLTKTQTITKQQWQNQQTRYRLGLISTKELEEARETYRQSRQSLLDNQYNQALSLVVLHQTVGNGVF